MDNIDDVDDDDDDNVQIWALKNDNIYNIQYLYGRYMMMQAA